MNSILRIFEALYIIFEHGIGNHDVGKYAVVPWYPNLRY